MVPLNMFETKTQIKIKIKNKIKATQEDESMVPLNMFETKTQIHIPLGKLDTSDSRTRGNTRFR